MDRIGDAWVGALQFVLYADKAVPDLIEIIYFGKQKLQLFTFKFVGIDVLRRIQLLLAFYWFIFNHLTIHILLHVKNNIIK